MEQLIRDRRYDYGEETYQRYKSREVIDNSAFYQDRERRILEHQRRIAEAKSRD